MIAWGGVLRDVLKVVRRQPLVAATCVVSVAVGVGVNAALLAVSSALFVTPSYFRDPAQLVRVFRMVRPGNPYGQTDVLGSREYEVLRAADFFDCIVTEGESGGTLGDFRPRITLAPGGRELAARAVSAGYFTTLGVPIRGRDISGRDDEAGRTPVAILSEITWRGEFGAASSTVGRVVLLSGVSTEIIGVVKGSFRGTRLDDQAEIWIPLRAVPAFTPVPRQFADRPPVRLIGRLHGSQALSSAEARIGELLGPTYSLKSLAEDRYPVGLARSAVDDRRVLSYAVAAAALILVLGAVNLAGLCLARVQDRWPEISVRLCLGAAGVHIAMLLGLEVLVLVGLGAVLGVACARGILASIASMSLPSGLSVGAITGGIEGRIAGIAFLIGLLCASACAFLVWWRTAIGKAATSLRPSLDGLAVRRTTLWSGMLVAHVTVAMMLGVVAALFLRSAQHGKWVDLGFPAERLVGVSVQPAAAQHAPGGTTGRDESFGMRRAADYRRLLRELEMLRLVESVSQGALPLAAPAALAASAGLPGLSVEVLASSVPLVRAAVVAGGPGYCETLGARLKAGRYLTEQDTITPGGGAAVVSESLARLLAPGRVLGSGIRIAGEGVFEVVGVVADIVRLDPRRSPTPVVYITTGVPTSEGTVGFNILVRVTGRAEDTLHEIRRAVEQVFPNPARLEIQSGERAASDHFRAERLGARLLGWLTASAMFLSALGVYGLVAITTARRTREFAIRKALGASDRSLLAVAVVPSARPVLIGVLAGSASASALGGLLKSYLFGVSRIDPVSHALSAALLVTVAGVAALLASRRARSVAPAIALKAE